jgi:Outer membrane protein beta-barrel domain
MKKTILTAVIAFAAIFGTNSYAQNSPAQFGVKVGGGVANFTGDLDGTKSKAGLDAGVTFGYQLAPNVYLLSGLDYIAKGAKAEEGSESLSMNLGYIELPIHIGYKIPVAEGTKFVIQAGPYFAYAVKGTLKSGAVSLDWFGDSSDFEGSFFVPKRFDAGLGVGVGLEFGKMSIGLDVDYGLVNIYKGSDGSIKNLSSSLSIGYKF